MLKDQNGSVVRIGDELRSKLEGNKLRLRIVGMDERGMTVQEQSGLCRQYRLGGRDFAKSHWRKVP